MRTRRRKTKARKPASGGQSQDLGPLAQMLLSQDTSELAAAIANAASAAGLSDIRYFTQRGLFSSRILEQMGIQRLNDDLDDLTAANPALAERLTVATDALRETVRQQVSQALLLYGREEAENLRNEILRNAPLSRIEPRQIEQMRALIRQMARRLRERFSQAAQAAAPRSSRRAADAAQERRLGQRALSHRVEAQASRQAEDRRDLRRLRARWRGCPISFCC